MEQSQINDIKAALEILNAKAAKYQTFYDYYGGKHTLNFASEKFKNKFGRRLQTLRQNLCKTVVKAPASRLEIINFLSDKANTENPAWQFWKKSKMPKNCGKIHREAFKTGEAFVIVWTDKTGEVVIQTQTAANCHVWKSGESGETEKAAKAWKGSDGFYYLTLYYSDRIEKYVTRKKPATLPLNPKAFDVRIVDGENFPLNNPFDRVPVFQFAFDEEVDDLPNSILTDVIPLNDALNKAWADIFGAQEENMRRRRYAAGLQVETDEETQKKINPFKPDDDLWTSEDAEVKFGEFSEANVEQMLKVLEATIKGICLVSGVPPSYFNLESTGSAISGEALRKLEARFTAIVQDAQRSFGETWAEVVKFKSQIKQEKIKGEIETQWTDAAPVSESELLDNALKKLNLGWSIEQIQRDYGLTDAQIKKMLEETSARETQKVERAAKFFDGGSSLIE